MYQLRMKWRKPVQLGGKAKREIYRQVEEEPGIYVFLRKTKKGVRPIYVGRTNCVRGRLKTYLGPYSHLKTDLPPSRSLFYLPCGIAIGKRPLPKFGSETEYILAIVEVALISFLLGNRYKLVNSMSTKNGSVLRWRTNEYNWSPSQIRLPKIPGKRAGRPTPKYHRRKR